MSIDPIADKFAFVSPFNYAENEPIRNIDLHGLQKYDAVEGFDRQMQEFYHQSSTAAFGVLAKIGSYVDMFYAKVTGKSETPVGGVTTQTSTEVRSNMEEVFTNYSVNSSTGEANFHAEGIKVSSNTKVEYKDSEKSTLPLGRPPLKATLEVGTKSSVRTDNGTIGAKSFVTLQAGVDVKDSKSGFSLFGGGFVTGEVNAKSKATVKAGAKLEVKKSNNSLGLEFGIKYEKKY